MGIKSKFGKCVNVPQIKALLWKDLLIKKRQPVNFGFCFFYCSVIICTVCKCHLITFILQWMTAVQFLWPCLIFVTIYMLRLKFGASDVEECQFPTRELPTPRSILPFFQSYICTIENQCSSPKNYSEISEFQDAP